MEENPPSFLFLAGQASGFQRPGCFLFPVEKFIHRRGNVLWDICAPNAAVDDFTIGLALRVKLEKDWDTVETEAVLLHIPAPLIHIQPDEINAVKGIDEQFVVRVQTGRDGFARRSPIGVEFNDG
jgi:hypothetical protein